MRHSRAALYGGISVGWRSKSIVAFALVFFFVTCAWLGYAVYARYQGNEYLVRLAASFNAATLVNAEETYVEPRYQDLQFRIALDRYNKIGAEGQLRHDDNGIDRTYESSWISAQLLNEVTPYVGVPTT